MPASSYEGGEGRINAIVQYSPTLKRGHRQTSVLIARLDDARSGGNTEPDSLGEFRREIDDQI